MQSGWTASDEIDERGRPVENLGSLYGSDCRTTIIHEKEKIRRLRKHERS
jgi:hypothetical protein